MGSEIFRGNFSSRPQQRHSALVVLAIVKNSEITLSVKCLDIFLIWGFSQDIIGKMMQKIELLLIFM